MLICEYKISSYKQKGDGFLQFYFCSCTQAILEDMKQNSFAQIQLPSEDRLYMGTASSTKSLLLPGSSIGLCINSSPSPLYQMNI